MNRFLLILLLACVPFCAFAQQEPGQIPSPVRVTGLVDHPLTLDAATIRTFRAVQGKAFDLVNDKGEVKKTFGSYKGIPLSDIIAQAGVQIAGHKEQGKYYIVVTATDGYQVVFGYDEVMYGGPNTAAYLLLELDGKPLGAATPYIMACPGDRVTGPRHIRMVQEIDVRKI